MVDIQNIKVYDPKTGGLDFKTYSGLFKTVEAVNRTAAYAMHDGLMEKVLKSKVEKGLTLKDFLFGDNGYLSQFNTTAGVIFMDGKFHSKYVGNDEYLKIELDQLAEEANAIPFMFMHDPATDQWLREREAMEALMKTN